MELPILRQQGSKLYLGTYLVAQVVLPSNTPQRVETEIALAEAFAALTNRARQVLSSDRR